MGVCLVLGGWVGAGIPSCQSELGNSPSSAACLTEGVAQGLAALLFAALAQLSIYSGSPQRICPCLAGVC
eukprot:1159498-Pelagomonas_calceolata.AAC.6